MNKKSVITLVLFIVLFICSTFILYHVVDNTADKNHLITKLNKVKTINDSLLKNNIHLKDSITNILTFNKKNVKRLLKFYDIKHSNIVLKQAKLETGNFTSKIFADNNNLFGMKEARIRPTTSTGTNLGHATYNNYIDSIKDYKLWQMTLYDKTRYGSNYFGFLSAIGYATDKNYIRKLRN